MSVWNGTTVYILSATANGKQPWTDLFWGNLFLEQPCGLELPGEYISRKCIYLWVPHFKSHNVMVPHHFLIRKILINSKFRHHDRISSGCGSTSFKYGNYISNEILLGLTLLVFCTKTCLVATAYRPDWKWVLLEKMEIEKNLSQEKEFWNENALFAFDSFILYNNTTFWTTYLEINVTTDMFTQLNVWSFYFFFLLNGTVWTSTYVFFVNKEKKTLCKLSETKRSLEMGIVLCLSCSPYVGK